MLAALPLFVLRPVLAREIPPYPFQAPPWMLAFREKLKAPMRADLLKGISLQKALEKVSAATGMRVRIAADATKALQAAEKPVLLQVGSKEQPADSVLSLLLGNFHLTYKFDKEGVVIIEPKQADAVLHKAEWIGNWIQDVRRNRFPTKEEKVEQDAARSSYEKAEKERTKEIETKKKALRSNKVTKDFVDSSFDEILKWLQKASKVNLVLSRAAADKVRSEASKLTIKGGSRSAENVLDDLVRSRGLKYELWQSEYKIRLDSEPPPQNWYTIISKEEQEQGERRIFDQRLTRDLKSSRVCDFLDDLSKDLGVKIYPDSRSWGSEVKLTRKSTGISVREFAAILKRQGIEVVIWASPFFERPQPWSPWSGQPRPIKPPPGAKKVDWAIYLVQPEN